MGRLKELYHTAALVSALHNPTAIKPIDYYAPPFASVVTTSQGVSHSKDIYYLTNQATNIQSELPQQRILNIHGFHTIAQKIETPEQMEITFRDALMLGVRNITAIQPSEEFLKRAKELKITVIARVDLPGNNYHDHNDRLQQVIDNYKAVGLTPIIQVGNEIDIETMQNTTSGVHEQVDIENYTLVHFLPAFWKVKESGGIIITPPLATADIKNEKDFPKHLENYRKMARIIERATKLEDRKGHLALGIHDYIFYPYQDPFDYLQSVAKVYHDVFKEDYPIYVTEAGVSENVQKFTKDEIAMQLRILLLMQLPPNLSILAWDTWLQGGTGIRSEMTPEFIAQNKAWLERDDKVAFRSTYTSVNPNYLMLQQLVWTKGSSEQKIAQLKQLQKEIVIYQNKNHTASQAARLSTKFDLANDRRKDRDPKRKLYYSRNKPNIYAIDNYRWKKEEVAA